ncbi:GlsB/YeaQ/YmgE family stress response membrane protein [Oxalobacteraceae bacterium OM1]|nr:GlsB/YeaQ/YmgE family stress response membrane protein [Oxalobacteraceae bacterium OM1]
MEFVWFLLVGLIAGWLASVLVGGGGMGVVGDIIVGIIGAFLGGWLFGKLGISAGGGMLGSIITATVGAIILIFLLRLVRRA